MSHSEACSLFVRGRHTLNRYCVAVYGSILRLFTPFFSVDYPFKSTRQFLFFVARLRHKFREIAIENFEKSKIGGNLCAHDFL